MNIYPKGKAADMPSNPNVIALHMRTSPLFNDGSIKVKNVSEHDVVISAKNTFLAKEIYSHANPYRISG